MEQSLRELLGAETYKAVSRIVTIELDVMGKICSHAEREPLDMYKILVPDIEVEFDEDVVEIFIEAVLGGQPEFDVGLAAVEHLSYHPSRLLRGQLTRRMLFHMYRLLCEREGLTVTLSDYERDVHDWEMNGMENWTF